MLGIARCTFEGFIFVNDTKGVITGVGRIGIGALT